MKRIVCLAVAVLALGTAHAQRHRGSSTYQDPYPTQYSSSSASIPSIGEAPAWLGYMNARCAALHDAIRTGPARGLTSATMNAQRKEYSSECRENEQEAMQQYNRDKREGKLVQQREQQAQATASERAKQRQQQCEESKRILRMKKARTDLTEGERADLQRFEDNYKARCT